MSNYTFPDLSNHKIIYKGRRYIAFEVSQSNPCESMEDTVFEQFYGLTA